MWWEVGVCELPSSWLEKSCVRKEMWHARGRSPSRILRASITGRNNGASTAALVQHVGELSARSCVDDEEERDAIP